MAEWSKAAVSKTVIPSGYQGFKSPSLRHFAKMANEAARLHFTVPSGTTSHLHAATAALHSKDIAFLSLSRRCILIPIRQDWSLSGGKTSVLSFFVGLELKAITIQLLQKGNNILA